MPPFFEKLPNNTNIKRFLKMTPSIVKKKIENHGILAMFYRPSILSPSQLSISR